MYVLIMMKRHENIFINIKRIVKNIFISLPDTELNSHAPKDIALSSWRTHSTFGGGYPFAAHRRLKCSPSRTIIDRGLFVLYSAAVDII